MLKFMTDRAVDKVLFNKMKLGAGKSTAAGSIDGGIEAGTTTKFRENVSAYSKPKRLFASASLDGAVIDT
jgi:lipid-binding SYLF domain-containing protein